MSFASHNPEVYDEIVQKGILRWMDTVLSKHGFEVPGEWQEGYRALLEAIQATPETRSLYENILLLSQRHVIESEQDYWGGRIDAAKESQG